MSEQAKQYDPPRTWQLKLRALPDNPRGPSHVQRMRLLLKSALRTHGFVCEGVMIPSELPPVPTWLDPTKAEPPFHPSPEARKQQETDERAS